MPDTVVITRNTGSVTVTERGGRVVVPSPGVRIVTAGVQGPQGPTGPQGPQGPPGTTPDLSAYARKGQANTFTAGQTINADSGNAALTVKANGANCVTFKNHNGAEVGNVNANGTAAFANYYNLSCYAATRIGSDGQGIVLGSPNIDTNVQVKVENNSPSKTAFLVKGVSGQTADLHQWQDSTGSVLARVDRDGNLVFGGDTNNKPCLRLGPTVISQYSGVSLDVGTEGAGSWGQFNQTDSNCFGVWAKNDRHLCLRPSGPAHSVLVRGHPGQTADLHQWQGSTGTALARFDKDGYLYANKVRNQNSYLEVGTQNGAAGNASLPLDVFTGVGGTAAGAGQGGNGGGVTIRAGYGGDSSGASGSRPGDGGHLTLSAGNSGYDILDTLGGNGGNVTIGAGGTYGDGRAGSVNITAGTNSSYLDPSKQGGLYLGTATTSISMDGGGYTISINALRVEGETYFRGNEIGAGATGDPNTHLFKVDFDGFIYTNQIDIGPTTLGSIVGRMKVRTADGSAEYYIPVYDNIS